jgi:hypothetical protein
LPDMCRKILLNGAFYAIWRPFFCNPYFWVMLCKIINYHHKNGILQDIICLEKL